MSDPLEGRSSVTQSQRDPFGMKSMVAALTNIEHYVEYLHGDRTLIKNQIHKSAQKYNPEALEAVRKVLHDLLYAAEYTERHSLQELKFKGYCRNITSDLPKEVKQWALRTGAYSEEVE